MDEVQFSICIVTYQARDYLHECLDSLVKNPPPEPYEVIVVDNGSTDGTLEMLAGEFPWVQVIKNDANAGYTRPMNQALRQSRGRYAVQLNPDTVVLPESLARLAGFMEAHPEVGICGPKVLNRDGTLQKPCRRGEPRPWAVISYFSGLARLFPNSARFGEYLLNYLPEDQAHPAAGVSGSCMLIRRDVIEQIGYLDEQFFAYQEDADYCRRARQAGWQVFYVPDAQIVHYASQGGSRVEPYRSIVAWHKSYYLYYRKHLAGEYFFLFNGLYYGLMLAKLVWSLGLSFIRRDLIAGARKP